MGHKVKSKVNEKETERISDQQNQHGFSHRRLHFLGAAADRAALLILHLGDRFSNLIHDSLSSISRHGIMRSVKPFRAPQADCRLELVQLALEESLKGVEAVPSVGTPCHQVSEIFISLLHHFCCGIVRLGMIFFAPGMR